MALQPLLYFMYWRKYCWLRVRKQMKSTTMVSSGHASLTPSEMAHGKCLRALCSRLWRRVPTSAKHASVQQLKTCAGWCLFNGPRSMMLNNGSEVHSGAKYLSFYIYIKKKPSFCFWQICCWQLFNFTQCWGSLFSFPTEGRRSCTQQRCWW